MANPNIVQATAIYGKTNVMNVTTTATAIVTNPAASGKVLRVTSLVVSNIDGTGPVDISVALNRSSVDYAIAQALSLPATSSIVVVGKENPAYLNEGDSLRVTAGADGDSQAICSYEEIG